MAYQAWCEHVEQMDVRTAQGLPDQVVARLVAVETGTNRERDYCVALLRDLNKNSIPKSVKVWFYKPLIKLSRSVGELRYANRAANNARPDVGAPPPSQAHRDRARSGRSSPSTIAPWTFRDCTNTNSPANYGDLRDLHSGNNSVQARTAVPLQHLPLGGFPHEAPVHSRQGLFACLGVPDPCVETPLRTLQQGLSVQDVAKAENDDGTNGEEKMVHNDANGAGEPAVWGKAEVIPEELPQDELLILRRTALVEQLRIIADKRARAHYKEKDVYQSAYDEVRSQLAHLDEIVKGRAQSEETRLQAQRFAHASGHVSSGSTISSPPRLSSLPPPVSISSCSIDTRPPPPEADGTACAAADTKALPDHVLRGVHPPPGTPPMTPDAQPSIGTSSSSSPSAAPPSKTRMSAAALIGVLQKLPMSQEIRGFGPQPNALPPKTKAIHAFECPESECKYSCARQAHLDHHRLIHLPPGHRDKKPHACERCPHRYAQKSHLTRHIRIVHELIVPYGCNHAGCSKSFSQKSNLANHLDKVHGDFRLHPHACPVVNCNKHFASEKFLKNHLRKFHL